MLKPSKWATLRRRPVAALAAVITVAVMLAPSSAPGAGSIEGLHPAPLADVDARPGGVAPTIDQLQRASELGATVSWNRFGTPQSLSKPGSFLATGVAGDSAVAAARAWLDANKALFRLASTGGLALYGDSKLAHSNGHAVHFRQEFGGLAAAHDGLVTVGLTGTPAGGWSIAYVSSSLTSEPALAASPKLSPKEAWLRAAGNVGRAVSIVALGDATADREWTVFGASGFGDLQRVRPAAVPTPTGGVRPAFETLVLDNWGGSLTGYRSLVDAETGAILVRENLVHQSHPTTPETFSGAVPQTDNACAPDNGPWVVTAGESVQSIEAPVFATLTTNDSVIHLVRNGVTVQTVDTATSPEAIHYAPTGGVPAGSYTVRVCDFQDGAPWLAPNTYTGTIAFNEAAPTTVPPYPPKWRVFPANPLPPALPGYPWNVPGTDTRTVWCWDSEVQGNPISGCEDEVGNSAARVPWDFDPDLDQPTFTTRGNTAISSESWYAPLSPGPTGFQPQSAARTYSFPWTNEWYTERCDPTNFVTGVSNDISAAVTNLFAMHNRMHDWSYHLGFTEENWNGQQNNFGGGGAAGDPLLGQAQAGGADGGYPAYLGRDNANMRTLPDGVSSITNMYLWQPIRGSFYAPCVDGDYDMAIIGHEFGHMIENRMIGKGANRTGHHAGAMGESNGDLNAMEILNEYGLVPVAGENPYAVGAYATGSKERGIRNYGMNDSPLNFSDLGWDPLFSSATPVHNDGEIWSATNFDIRQALVEKYNATHPASDAAAQQRCAEGLKAPEDCPGNRRWVQLMYDAYLLMPTGPTMLQARDAYLAADVMRFGGANQRELWLAFARRGMGAGAFATNAHSTSETDPKPDFASPLHSNATVTFQAVASDEGNVPVTTAKIYVGRYEARASPVADTNPATNAGPPGANTLDDTAQFAPGTYEFIVRAPGHGAVRFTRTFAAGSAQTLAVAMPTNYASSSKGASATGSNGNVAALIDDTENTTWTATGAPSAQAVTVDLAGAAPVTVGRVQVSSMLQNGQNRFTALRKFRVDVSTDGSTFVPAFTSAEDAFPGASPRPLIPNMALRSFTLPSPVQATHVRLVVLETQCTGQAEFHGVQDDDVANGTDCRGQGEPPGTDPAGASGQTPPPQNTSTRAAEFQVFSNSGEVAPAPTLTLAPPASTSAVGSQDCTTASLVHGAITPANKRVVFSVTGAHATTASKVTDATGQAKFCYRGTTTGNDTIAAFADLNANGTQDDGEPGDTASRRWVPPSTSNCEVKITQEGTITTADGQTATFGGEAKVSKAGVASGSLYYQDHGPNTPINVRSLDVQAFFCPGTAGHASIFGRASVDGSGPVDYEIQIVDGGQPGTNDRFGIKLAQEGTGFYDSGVQTLRAGNIQLHK